MIRPFFSTRHFLITCLFCYLWGTCALRSQENAIPALGALKLELDVNRAELMKPIKELQENYERQLTNLLNQVSGAGNLEKALLVKAEIGGFRTATSKPAGDDFPELKRVQGIYADALAQRLAAMNARLKPVYDDYRTKLADLQKQLTQEQKLEDALKVKAVIEGIAAEMDLPSATGQAAPGRLTGPAAGATMDKPFVNSLEMRFVPVPITGGPTDGKLVLFSVWETRVNDFQPFVRSERREWRAPSFEQGENHPAVQMSREDAQAFCEWLTTKERKSRMIGENDRYRLPSDHEWSCGMGIGKEENADEPAESKDSKLKVYPWGTEWPPPVGAGNYRGEEVKVSEAGSAPFLPGYNDGWAFSAPVGSFQPNPLGLFDIGGNVAEWTDGWLNPNEKSQIPFRGASWNDYARDVLLSSRRHTGTALLRKNYVGFRCLLEIGGNSPHL